jgi:hypothetical protein
MGRPTFSPRVWSSGMGVGVGGGVGDGPGTATHLGQYSSNLMMMRHPSTRQGGRHSSFPFSYVCEIETTMTYMAI